jgi:3'(2'), 5'-bisphosphate nucleotidase
MTSSPTPELLQLTTIAHAAGRVIMDIYSTDFTSRRKEDNSVVTEADEKAEHLILQNLNNIWPQIPVIAEENTADGKQVAIGDRFFLVDPLDGTREFLKRNGEFTVNIALIENGEPIWGVIYAPAKDKMFVGAQSAGAYSSMCEVAKPCSGLQWTRLQVSPDRPGGPIAIASRSHSDKETAAFLEKNKPQQVVSTGSSLKFCLIAEGSADLYPRFGRTMEWDTAAGQAILEASGGHVRDLSGQRMSYGHEDRGFLNPSFIASAS